MPDTIYSGGKIITINDAQPTAEAVAVRDGKIIAVGNKDELMKTGGKNTRLVNLNGKTMLPGFVDSHGHAYAIGLQASTANLLPAPDGTGNSVAAIQKLLTDWAANNKQVVERVGWIAGFGYDDSQLADERHPTRDDLDKVSKDIPVIIVTAVTGYGGDPDGLKKFLSTRRQVPPPEGYFSKPIDREEFIAKIRQLLP